MWYKEIKFKLNSFLFLSFLFFSSFLVSQNSIVTGKLIDELGEPSLFALVIIGEGEYTTMTNLEGVFTLELPAGRYKLSGMQGGLKIEINIVVLSGETKDLGNLVLKPTAEKIEEVVISVNNSVKSSVAIQRQIEKSVVVKSGTSKEDMKRSGDGNAGQAAKRIPGISIVGGKYVFIRGIGDRYNKTTINGVDIPGLDPDRNSIQMDLFPSNIIDNIMISKSLSADIPANFAGGVIDLGLKDFPDKKESSLGISAGYNPSMHFNNDYLTYDGGSLDFLGLSGKERDIPSNIVVEEDILFGLKTSNDWNSYINQFDKQMDAYESSSLMDLSISGGHGNQLQLKNNGSIGYNFSTSYSNTTKYYGDAEFGDYGMKENVDSIGLNLRNNQKGRIANNSVLLSLMGGVCYKKDLSKIKLNVLRIQNGVKRAGQFDFNKDDQGNDFFGRKNTLGFNERILNNVLFEVKHKFGFLRDSLNKKTGKPKWELSFKLSPTISSINDPDIRSVSYEVEDGNFITNSNVGFPSRLWRSMSETTLSSRIDFTRRIKEKNNLKFGAASTYKLRDFDIRSFNIEGSVDGLIGSGNEIWDNVWDGDISTIGGSVYRVKPDFIPNSTNAYQSRSLYNAGYVSTEISTGKKLKSIIGLRVEKFDQWYSGEFINSTNGGGLDQINDSLVLSDFDLFPTINMIYSLSDNKNNRQNLRLSASKTIARPSMKEKSYAIIIDPFTGRTFNGGSWALSNDNGDLIWNGDLVSTDIINLDLRWESFQKISQTVSLSTFYKNFKNPIEIVQFATANNNIQPQNVGTGNLIGGEFDLVKRLTFLDSNLVNWSFNTNFTYTYSQIKMSENEYKSKLLNARTGQEIKEFRSMAGQAPYLINAGLSYLGGLKDSTIWTGLQIGLFYNVQGKTLQIVGIADKPDIYTKPFHSLNLTASKKFNKRNNDGDITHKHSIGFKISNILNDSRESIFDAYGVDNEYLFSKLSPGMAVKMSYSLKF